MSRRPPKGHRKPSWFELRSLLARRVFFLKAAFEYLSRILPRKRAPEFDNSRNLKICKLPCQELLDLSCGQQCITVRLHRSDKRLAEFSIGYAEDRAIGHPGHSDQCLL